MASLEVSRTLVKSPPELWDELQGERLREALGGGTIRAVDFERSLEWETEGVRGTARLEESGFGTRVTLTAEVEEEVAEGGVWARMRGVEPPPPPQPDLEERLVRLLDDLGSAHRKPFQG